MTRIAVIVLALILPGTAFAAAMSCVQALPIVDQEYRQKSMFLRDPQAAGRQLAIAHDLCGQGRDKEATEYLDLVRSQLQMPASSAQASPAPAPAPSGCAKSVPEARQTFEQGQARMLPRDRETVEWNLRMAEDACHSGNEKGAGDYLKVVRSQMQLK